MFDKVAYVQSMKFTCVLKCVVCSAGLQKMGPVGPGGFGQNIFGRTEGNVNSRQIGHNSQQIGQPHSRLDKLSSRWDKRS